MNMIIKVDSEEVESKRPKFDNPGPVSGNGCLISDLILHSKNYLRAID